MLSPDPQFVFKIRNTQEYSESLQELYRQHEITIILRNIIYASFRLIFIYIKEKSQFGGNMSLTTHKHLFTSP